jgi:hypothetical protein
MLRGPITLIFLQHNHSRITPGIKEKPVSALVPEPFCQPEYFLVKSFGSRQIFHAYGYFIEAFNG